KRSVSIHAKEIGHATDDPNTHPSFLLDHGGYGRADHRDHLLVSQLGRENLVPDADAVAAMSHCGKGEPQDVRPRTMMDMSPTSEAIRRKRPSTTIASIMTSNITIST